MNRTEYKKAMSGVQPSEQTIERIMDMTNSSKRKGLKKGILGVAIAVAILVCGGLTANAATDGVVAEAIDASIQSGIKRIMVIRNGKEVGMDEYIVSEKTYVNDEGDTVKSVDITLSDGNGVGYEIVSDDEGVEWSKEGDPSDEICIQMDDFNEPTTVVTE